VVVDEELVEAPALVAGSDRASVPVAATARKPVASFFIMISP
jgi:hypothetical protein